MTNISTAFFTLVAYFLGLAGAPRTATPAAGAIIAVNGLIFIAVIGFILLRRA